MPETRANVDGMAAPPDGIVLERHRDAPGSPLSRWGRRAFFAALVVFVALALVGFFGQPPRTSTAAAPAATLEVQAPTRVRGGLLFQGRFTVEASATVEHATLLLDRGWTEQLHINTIEPAPAAEESRDGMLALDFGRLEPGDTLVAYLQFQVNPASFGRRSQAVRLADGETVLASIDRTLVVFP